MRKILFFTCISICTLNGISSEPAAKSMNCDDQQQFEFFYTFLTEKAYKQHQKFDEMGLIERMEFHISQGYPRDFLLHNVNSLLEKYEPLTYIPSEIREAAEAIFNCLRKVKIKYYSVTQNYNHENYKRLLLQEENRDAINKFVEEFKEFKKSNQK